MNDLDNAIATMSKGTLRQYEKYANKWCEREFNRALVSMSIDKLINQLSNWSIDKRPGSFYKLRRALEVELWNYGKFEASAKIRKVTRVGAPDQTKEKKKRCQKITLEQHKQLVSVALKRNDHELFAALTLSWFTGARPCELPYISFIQNDVGKGTVDVRIKSAKKNKNRGIDRIISITASMKLIRIAIKLLYRLSKKQIENIRRRMSILSHKLWSINPPTLYSYRYQMGSDLKAFFKNNRIVAAVLGHISKKSSERYGRRFLSGGRGRVWQVPDPSPVTVAKVHLYTRKEKRNMIRNKVEQHRYDEYTPGLSR